MGQDIRIVFLEVCGAYLLGALLVTLIAAWLAKPFKKSKIAAVIVALAFVIFPFRRLIFYKTLFYFYGQSPLQAIHKTVDNPVSVYWEDNVWPGFDNNKAIFNMVDSYLDGKHLKMLALNNGGKVRVYEANEKDRELSRELAKEVDRRKQEREVRIAPVRKLKEEGKEYKPLRDKILHALNPGIDKAEDDYRLQQKKETEAIMARVKVFDSPIELPPVKYKVTFDMLPPSWVVNNKYKMLHADRISIVETKTGKEIASNVRYMAYSGWLGKLGPICRGFDYKLGDVNAYIFTTKILFGYMYKVKRGYYREDALNCKLNP